MPSCERARTSSCSLAAYLLHRGGKGSCFYVPLVEKPHPDCPRRLQCMTRQRHSAHSKKAAPHRTLAARRPGAPSRPGHRTSRCRGASYDSWPDVEDVHLRQSSDSGSVRRFGAGAMGSVRGRESWMASSVMRASLPVFPKGCRIRVAERRSRSGCGKHADAPRGRCTSGRFAWPRTPKLPARRAGHRHRARFLPLAESWQAESCRRLLE